MTQLTRALTVMKLTINGQKVGSDPIPENLYPFSES